MAYKQILRGPKLFIYFFNEPQITIIILCFHQKFIKIDFTIFKFYEIKKKIFLFAESNQLFDAGILLYTDISQVPGSALANSHALSILIAQSRFTNFLEILYSIPATINVG